MTRFLFRLILFFALIFTLTIFLARPVGSLRPAMALSTIMAKPDGTACDHPCLFGIRPGETSVEQAKSILHSHPLTRDATWMDDHTLRLPGPDAFVAFSLTQDKLIDAITFTDNLTDTGLPIPGSLADSIVLGEVILAFGTPNIAIPGSNYLVAEFDKLGVTAAVARPYKLDTYTKPGTSLSMIMINDFRPCPRPINNEVHSWMGFKPFRRYVYDRMVYKLPHRFSGVPVPPFAICQHE